MRWCRQRVELLRKIWLQLNNHNRTIVQSLASFRRLREINETEAVLIVLVNSCGPAILTVKQIRADYETQTGTTLHKEAIFN